MKKIIAIILLAVALLTACGRASNVYVNQKTYNTPKPSTNTSSTISTPKIETEKCEYEIEHYIVKQTSYKSLFVIFGIRNTGNTNIDIGGGQVDIVSKDGNLIDSLGYPHEFPEIVPPGERGWLVFYNPYGADYDVNEMDVEPHLRITKASKSCIRYKTENCVLGEARRGAELKGFVINETAEDFTCCVAVLLYNADDELIAWGYNYPNVPAGERQGFEVSIEFNENSLDDVDHYEVIAYPWL